MTLTYPGPEPICAEQRLWITCAHLHLHRLRSLSNCLGSLCIWRTEGNDFVVPKKIQCQHVHTYVVSTTDLQESLELLPCDVVLLQIKLEEVGIERRRSRLILRVVVRIQVGVLQAFFDGHSFLRADCTSQRQ